MQACIAQQFENREIILLNEKPDLGWNEASKKWPTLTKGWLEISKIDPEARFDLIRDYWFNALPRLSFFRDFLHQFFEGVEEVSVVGIGNEVYLGYGLVGKETFFLGKPPLVDDEIADLEEAIDFPLSEGFLKFFRIHDGFFRAGDGGLFSSAKLLQQPSASEPYFPFHHAFSFDKEEGVVGSTNNLSFPSFLYWLIFYLEGA